jgi:hypothetical protein
MLLPSEAPDITVVIGQHHDVSIHVSIPQYGQPSEYVTQKGYHSFVMRYCKDDEGVSHEENTTRLHFTLLFNEEDYGKFVTVTVAWINPRIQHGQWSDEIRVLIH